MADEASYAARLIPTSGIGGAEEQERRATSALLAVMAAVKEFARAITVPLGAPTGKVETFIEMPFALGERNVFPDGLIRITRGNRTWVALVEVKTGTNQLSVAQIEMYLDVAAQQGFDAVLTISHEITPIAGTHPIQVDRRRLRKVALHHLSWTQVLIEAVMQNVHRGVEDPDQAWILSELIRYLEHPRSGALQFADMGASWVKVREAVASGTMRATDKGAAEVASRWDQLVRYACLSLGRRLGVEVAPVLTRKELSEPATRAQALVAALVADGKLQGALRIPNTVGPIVLTADLRASRITVSVDLDAPREGRALTRVNWLTRQLKEAPDTLRVDCYAMHNRGSSTSELLRDIRQKPALLIPDPKREPRAFHLALTAPMGTKRGTGRGGFVSAVLELLDNFYESTVQTIKPWSAAPPKLRQELDEIEVRVPVEMVSTSLSSQDGSEPPDAEVLADEATEPSYLYIPHEGEDDDVTAPDRPEGRGGIDLSRSAQDSMPAVETSEA